MSSEKQATKTTDEIELKELNQGYIAAFMNADVDWYAEHLADDFVCIESDGAILNKAQGLMSANTGSKNVQVRMFGDAALVHGMGLFTREDGSTGTSRYTDVYVRNGPEWKAVSAQVTRTTKLNLNRIG